MTAIVETFSFVGPKVPSIRKAPGVGAILDYTFNWTAWLATTGDSIASAVVTLDGVDLVSQTDSWPRVHIKISGGVVNTIASASCKITTTQGRTDTRTMYFLIRVR